LGRVIALQAFQGQGHRPGIPQQAKGAQG